MPTDASRSIRSDLAEAIKSMSFRHSNCSIKTILLRARILGAVAASRWRCVAVKSVEPQVAVMGMNCGDDDNFL